MLNLSAAGLNPTESKVYEALLSKESWQPSMLAKTVGESRTNIYKVLDTLVALGLAKKFIRSKKSHYRATDPALLVELARRARLAREKSEQELALHVRDLTRQYIQTHELPSIQFYQGTEQLKAIYQDQIRTKQPIYIIRPDFNIDQYDMDFLAEIKQMARASGIPRFAITPDRKSAPKNYKESDAYMLMERTWIPQNTYTAPVEWNAYGDKVAIMSFGNEAIGMILESPQIAEAFRQLYALLRQGLRLRPDYDSLPKEAQNMGPVE